MDVAEVVSYSATLFVLLGYACRGFWLRVFSIVGCLLNMTFAFLILSQSQSARSIIISNIIYIAINVFHLKKEAKNRKNI